jgi:exopolysaccharide/PEP-CTERM locus tyrosine autokinase
MSIIERALHKVQGTSPAPAEAATAATARSRAAAKTRESAAPSVEVTHEARPARESIRVDSAALRESGVLPPQGMDERLTEQFRRVKRPILDLAMGQDASIAEAANVVLVTSSLAGEGKTFTTFNLALSVAREKDVSVLLVDADVAKRHVTQAMGLQERSGLTDVLADASLSAEDLVLDTSISGLSVLPAGQRTSAAPELFASNRMTETVRALKNADPRRVILFDSSPLLVTNESHILARLVDQVVFVVRAESTAQPIVMEAIGTLDKNKPIRCILNQARTSGMTEYYYGYGYQSNDSRPGK